MGNTDGANNTVMNEVPIRTLILHGTRDGDSLQQLACKHGGSFRLHHLPESADSQQLLHAATQRTPDGAINRSHLIVVLLNAASSSGEAFGSATASPLSRLARLLGLARETRASCPHAFILLWHPAATEDPAMRVEAFHSGANMVSYYPGHVEEVLTKLASIGSPGRGPSAGPCSCAWCGQCGLTADELWLHQPLYHIYDENRAEGCSACGQVSDNLAVHIHEEHYPGGPRHEARQGVGAAVVVHRRRDNKFLMVQEFAGQGYWVPGGATDLGESVRASAVRECLEEAGVEVQLTGLAEVDYVVSPETGKVVWRLAVFYAAVGDEVGPPKTVPCFESAGACWVGVEELTAVPLRSPRIPSLWFPHFAAGKPYKPLALPAELQHIFTDVEF